LVERNVIGGVTAMLGEVEVAKGDGVDVRRERERGSELTALASVVSGGACGEIKIDDLEREEVWCCCFGLEEEGVYPPLCVNGVSDVVGG
jgi:hypothetical protein